MSCDKFVMLEGSDSFRTWQGLKGAHFVPHVNDDGLLTWTNNGNLPNPAAVNIRGPAGQGLQISGIADSIENLPDSQPIGSVWLVGEESPYEAYAFFGEWIDIGEVQVGPAGPQGPQGEQGEPGENYVLTENDKTEIAYIVIAYAGIGSDELETVAQTIKGAINELYDGKVDKVTGKGLSQNDYTDAEKAKVSTATTDVSNLKTKVGTAALDTTNKNLSAAVNELKQNTDAKVAKAGDTMTGDLVIQKAEPFITLKDSVMDVTADSIAAEKTIQIKMQDKNALNAGQIEAVQSTDGTVQVFVRARRRNNDTNIYNGVYLGVNKNGGKTVGFDAPSAWRLALGLGDASGILPISISQGGSGQQGTIREATVSNILDAHSGTTINSATIFYWGKFAQLYVNFKVNVALSTSTAQTIATLKPGFRPANTCFTTGSQPTLACGYIADGGAINLRGTLAANTNSSIYATYILA